MRSKIALILLTLVVLTVGVMPEAQARGPYGSIRVAGWSGGAFTDDQTGQFSSCIANANYKSGIDFGVVVAKNGAWALAFSHPNWSLVRDQKFPIVLSFDGRNTFNVNGAVVSASTVFVRMPETS